MQIIRGKYNWVCLSSVMLASSGGLGTSAQAQSMEAEKEGLPLKPERKIEFTTTEKVFEPGTVVNFESQFFSPRMSGITYYIDTLMFKADTAFQPLKSPLDLVVVGD